MILVGEGDRVAAERRKKRLLAVYIAVACLYVAAALLILFLSTDRYTQFLIAEIAITTALGFYSVYFFSVAYSDAVKRSRLLDKVMTVLSEKEYGVYLREEDRMTLDGVEMRILLFSIRDTEREVRVLQGELTLREGDKYLLEMRAGVLVEIGGAND